MFYTLSDSFEYCLYMFCVLFYMCVYGLYICCLRFVYFLIVLGPFLDLCGITLASCWHPLGVNVASSWGHFRISLGSSWDQSGIIIGSHILFLLLLNAIIYFSHDTLLVGLLFFTPVGATTA